MFNRWRSKKQKLPTKQEMEKMRKKSTYSYLMNREIGGPPKKRMNAIERMQLSRDLNQGMLLRAIRPNPPGPSSGVPGGNPFRPITIQR